MAKQVVLLILLTIAQRTYALPACPSFANVDRFYDLFGFTPETRRGTGCSI